MGERSRATVVEVEPSGLTWRKSSASAGTNSDSCVEFGAVKVAILIRNSRDRSGARLCVAHSAWQALLMSARHRD